MASFEQQLIDCMPQLRGFIFKLVKDAQIIDDIAQDVLLNAWRARDTFKGDSKLSTWLYQIAKNEVARHYRKDNSNHHMDGLDVSNIKSNFDPFQIVLCADMIEACALTGRLSSRRKKILLEAMKGTPMWRISYDLGMAEGTVKSGLHRARQRLKKEPIFAHS